MNFQWRNLLDIAKYLETEMNNDSMNQEAYQRSIINRAYYAAFNSAVHWLTEIRGIDLPAERAKAKLSSKSIGTHEIVIDLLRNDKQNDSKRVAGILASMKADRVVADYNYVLSFVGGKFIEDVAVESISNAEYVCDLVDKLPKTI